MIKSDFLFKYAFSIVLLLLSKIAFFYNKKQLHMMCSRQSFFKLKFIFYLSYNTAQQILQIFPCSHRR